MIYFGLNCLPLAIASSLNRSNNSVYVLPRLSGRRQNATGNPTTQEYEYNHRRHYISFSSRTLTKSVSMYQINLFEMSWCGIESTIHKDCLTLKQ